MNFEYLTLCLIFFQKPDQIILVMDSTRENSDQLVESFKGSIDGGAIIVTKVDVSISKGVGTLTL